MQSDSANRVWVNTDLDHNLADGDGFCFVLFFLFVFDFFFVLEKQVNVQYNLPIKLSTR